jgi:hypothetical protein
LKLVPKTGLRFEQMDAALDTLHTASFGVRKQFLETCERCILADRVILPAEAEIYRAIAISLDCPVPPPSYS